MIFDYEFRNGLVFGLEHQTLLGVPEEDYDDPYIVSSWALHLGFVSLIVIFD